MMGRQATGREQLFYTFSMEDHVPEDHLLRGIHRLLDLGSFRQHMEAFYSPIGRPSVDPELMICMLIVGYCFGIRSERHLCEEAHLNLAYRWFCRLGLEYPVPNHSTFSKNRHGRFRESDSFRQVFEGALARCMAKGLVRRQGFATDASIIKADVRVSKRVPGNEPIDCPKQENTRSRSPSPRRCRNGSTVRQRRKQPVENSLKPSFGSTERPRERLLQASSPLGKSRPSWSKRTLC